MKRFLALLTLLCLLLAGCELPGIDLGLDTSVPTEASEEMGNPFYDENGNRIGTVMFYHDENGVLLREEQVFNDGSCVIYNYQYGSDGKKTGREYERSDGSSGVESFYENGSLQASRVLYADGTEIRNDYSESGALLWNSVVYTDGSKIESTYHENGMCKTNSLLCLDGTTIETTFHENGTVSSFVAKGSWGVYELNYETDGTPVGVERETGTPSSVHFEDIIGDVAGVMSKEYSPEGYLRRIVIEYEDLSRFKETYFENGMTESRKIENDYGRIEWSFYDNGAVRGFTHVADTVNYRTFILPNYKFGDQRIIDYNTELLRELTYDVTGVIVKSGVLELS